MALDEVQTQIQTSRRCRKSTGTAAGWLPLLKRPHASCPLPALGSASRSALAMATLIYTDVHTVVHAGVQV